MTKWRYIGFVFFFSSRRRHTRWNCDWSSDVCSSDLPTAAPPRSSTAGSNPAPCPRSEEHTSELQSQFHLVCRLLLEKKKKIKNKFVYKTTQTRIQTRDSTKLNR